MTFKLNVGDVCKLNQVIPGTYSRDDWKTGLYRVTEIRPGYGTSKSDWNDPRVQVYNFEKIKKDGTVYKNFSNGYRCQAWDRFIDEGRVTQVA